MSAALSVLPPSPPTTSSRKHTAHMPDLEYSDTIGNIDGLHALREPPLGTPDESPASFLGSGSVPGKSRKKVEFSPWTNIHNAPIFPNSSPKNISVRRLLPSRELSSSASILKTSSPLDLAAKSAEDEPQPQTSPVDMLESITQQLSRNEIAESIDAYQTLSSALKAYGEVPDAQAFKSKLGLLMQHVRRDLAVLEKCEYGPAEINLTTQTLKVLAILAWNRNFSILLSTEIQGYVLDRAIYVIEDHKAPKGVILHYLHLLSTQDFRHSIVASSGRVGRLLDALKDLTQHVRGNGIVSERLLVYHRLLEQARSHMKAKALLWIRELLDGLTSLHKETRTKAVGLGTKAVVVFPSSATVSHALRTALDMKLEDGKTAGIFACKRLEKMLASKDDCLTVPQIWAIVLSLMKGVEGGIAKWSGLKEWLKVIQRCFNSSNSAVRSQANVAWNRFVYVVSPSDVNESLLGVLVKPIAAQMERKGIEREDRTSRTTAFSAYCNLLYYSFRPSASHKQYDRVWDEYVVKVMTTSFLETSPAAADRACRIFMALFWNDNSKSKLWREIRAQENVLMEPEELPTIDCKWIRSKAFSILNIFKLVFQHSSWGSEDRPDQSFVATGWKHFCKALGAACSKEMKPSGETMQALTNTLAFLSDIWKIGPPALNALDDAGKDAFIVRFRFVCMNILTEIGAIPLIEGSVTADFANGHRETAASQESVPIVQFLGTLSSTSEYIIPNQAYCEFVTEILRLPRKSPVPVRLRIRLLCQSAASVLVENSQALAETAGSYVWQAISSAVQEEFDSSDSLVVLKPEIDNVLSDVVRILEIGLCYSPSSTTSWCALLERLIHLAEQGERQGAANISTIAHSLISYIEKIESPRLMMETAALTKYVVPSIKLSVAGISPKQAREKSRKKTSAIIPPLFNKLLFLLDFHLEQAYTSLSSEGLTCVPAITDAACQCFRSCPLQLLGRCLKALEKSLCLWLHDKQRLLTATSPAGAVKLIAGRKMCFLLIDGFGKLSEKDSDLEGLGSLLTAGFQSTHKLTVNQMVEMWNSTFGTKKQLLYPPALRAALERLQPFVDIELPSFGIYAAAADGVEAPTFVDSEDEDLQGKFAHTEPNKEDPMSTGNHRLLPRSRWKGTAFQSPILAPDVAAPAKEMTPVDVNNEPHPPQSNSPFEYVAIESSPLHGKETESQCLTDRQKEIRARRQAEPACVFPDLRPTSLQLNDDSTPIRSNSSSVGVKQAKDLEEDEPATPTLPMLANEGVDERMASSPTPQSKQPVLRLDDIEVPSSPPSIGGGPGLDAAIETISSQVELTSNAGLNDLRDHRLLSPRSYGDEVLESPAGSGVSSAPGQPLELSCLDVVGGTGDKGLADVGFDGHLRGQAPSLDYTPSIEPTKPSAFPMAAKGTKGSIVHTRGEDRDKVDDENVEYGAVRQDIEISNNGPFKPPILPLETDIQTAYAHQSLWPEEHNSRKENDNLANDPTEKIHLSVEMALVRPPSDSDAPQAETRNQMECFVLEENISKSPAADLLQREVLHSGVSKQSLVVTRHSPATSHGSYADCDEVDMLSASQLSQDLDWHMALEQRASGEQRYPDAGVRTPNRKRKQRVEYTPSPKRRKGIAPLANRSHLSVAQSSRTPSKTKFTEEVLDCIVLDTTPQQSKAANESSEPSPDAMNMQQASRKRGQKARQRRNTLPAEHSSPADSGSSSPSEGRSKVGALPTTLRSPPTLRTQNMSSNSSVAMTSHHTQVNARKVVEEPIEPPSVPNILHTEYVINTHNSVGVHQAESGQDIVNLAASTGVQDHLPIPTDRRQQTAELQANTLETGMPVDPSTVGAFAVDVAGGDDFDVIGSLQEVLRHLKSARMERPALRKVEDLLFEIRTEAQYAVGRELASQ